MLGFQGTCDVGEGYRYPVFRFCFSFKLYIAVRLMLRKNWLIFLELHTNNMRVFLVHGVQATLPLCQGHGAVVVPTPTHPPEWRASPPRCVPRHPLRRLAASPSAVCAHGDALAGAPSISGPCVGPPCCQPIPLAGRAVPRPKTGITELDVEVTILHRCVCV